QRDPLEWHFEAPQQSDEPCLACLCRQVIAVTAVLVDGGGLQQSHRVVESQCLERQLAESRELADRHQVLGLALVHGGSMQLTLGAGSSGSVVSDAACSKPACCNGPGRSHQPAAARHLDTGNLSLVSSADEQVPPRRSGFSCPD